MLCNILIIMLHVGLGDHDEDGEEAGDISSLKEYLADKENGLSRELGVRYPILQAIFSCKNHQKNWVCCI